MLIRPVGQIPSSEVTDEKVYLQRREFMRLAGGVAVGAALSPLAAACRTGGGAPSSDGDGSGVAMAAEGGQTPLEGVKPKVVATDEKLNTFQEITSYNNFYEFGTGKNDPQRYAGRLKTTPWKVKIDGLCAKPADYFLEDLIKPHQLEERIYRLRCVEAWSMVVPWVGIPLADIIRRAEPQGKAAFVEFTTLLRPAEMPGQREPALEWPYLEGLRMDEAMHPLEHSGRRPLREDVDEPERCPHPPGRPLEIRFQEHQVDRPYQVRRAATENGMEHRQPRGVRVLFERQS